METLSEATSILFITTTTTTSVLTTILDVVVAAVLSGEEGQLLGQLLGAQTLGHAERNT